MSQTLRLPTGDNMPIFGLGTLQSKDDEMVKAVETALDCGYKLIDTALSYENEAAIGKVLKTRFDSGRLKREDIFITSKLPGIYMGSRENVRHGFQLSYDALQLDYIDLYLIHSPVGLKLGPTGELFPKYENGKYQLENHDILETWKAMEELVDEGKVRAIGVSSFNSEQMERIRSVARHPIANNQVELHAYLPQYALTEFCQANACTVTAFSPLGSPALIRSSKKEYPILLDDPVVTQIALKHNKTPTQVLLRNLIQRNIAVIPKSVTPSRIKENIQIFDFELDDQDMTAIKGINKNLRTFTHHDTDEHPEWPFKIPF